MFKRLVISLMFLLFIISTYLRTPGANEKFTVAPFLCILDAQETLH